MDLVTGELDAIAGAIEMVEVPNDEDVKDLFFNANTGCVVEIMILNMKEYMQEDF